MQTSVPSAPTVPLGAGAASWTTVLAPLCGATVDAQVVATASALAARFGAQVVGAFTPSDPTEVMPWMGDGFLGSAQASALEALQTATVEGEHRARTALRATAGASRFVRLESPVWASLCAEARFADVTVFAPDAARGRGMLGEAFQHVLMDERSPVLVTRGGGLDRIAIAWDGGREATRAARAALPWLRTAAEVYVLVAPEATPRQFDPFRLQAWLSAAGVAAQTKLLTQKGDPGPILSEAVTVLDAEVLVAGAFGHPRFQQFIFGGATRALLSAETGPSLFLIH